MIGATKEGEYARSAELFTDIATNQGPFFALAFLIDSGYTHEDLKGVFRHMKPAKKD